MCGLRNQSVSTPSSDTRFSTPFEPTIAVFTAPARIRKPTTTTNAWNTSRSAERADHVHREAGDQVVVELRPHGVGDDRDREEADERR